MNRDAVSRFVRSLNKGPVGSDHPLHPYNSPEWFAGVQRSIPIPVFAALCGRSAAALAHEQAVSEQWRAKEAFVGR